MQPVIDWDAIRNATVGVKSAKTQGGFYLLPTLIWQHQADVVIEIGVEYGYTTAIIAATLAQLFGKPRMLSVDKSKRGYDCGTRIMGEHPKVRGLVLQSMSADVDYQERLRDVGARAAKVIYVDGCHTREAVEADIDATLPALASDGVYVFHDYIARFGVAEAVYDRFADSAEWNVFIIRVPLGMPFAIVQRHCEPL